MKRCKNCLMPDTKPGLILDDERVCQACRHYEMREGIDYEKRFNELKELTGRF